MLQILKETAGLSPLHKFVGPCAPGGYDMSDIGDILDEELEQIEIEPEVLDAMTELAYTASESGRIPIKYHHKSDIVQAIRLVRLAEKYKNGVPDKLRY